MTAIRFKYPAPHGGLFIHITMWQKCSPFCRQVPSFCLAFSPVHFSSDLLPEIAPWPGESMSCIDRNNSLASAITRLPARWLHHSQKLNFFHLLFSYDIHWLIPSRKNTPERFEKDSGLWYISELHARRRCSYSVRLELSQQVKQTTNKISCQSNIL